MSMKKTFNITVEMLQSKGASEAELSAFLDEFPLDQYPDGVDYQDVLNRCAEGGHPGYAQWFLNKFGATSTVLIVDRIKTDGFVFYSGTVIVRGNIKCGGIKAGGDIKAGLYIKAGESITAGGVIKSGDDYGIYAGLSVPIPAINGHAKIAAKEKPANIICGKWED